jgi:NADH-quinone oxidoreductase subunit A
MNGYIPLLVMILATAGLAIGMVTASAILGPKKPSGYKSSSYECGMSPVGTARERFPIKFYLIAMLFIVFDIETIFLYPWAVTYSALPYALKLFEFVEMLVFVVILFVGYFYILGKGALDWDESEAAKSNDRHDPAVVAPRPPLRYGNEDSGPVDIEHALSVHGLPSYGASSQEQGRQATGVGSGSGGGS